MRRGTGSSSIHGGIAVTLAWALVGCAAMVTPADVGNAIADDASHADTGFDRPPICRQCEPCDCTCADRIGNPPRTEHIPAVPVFTAVGGYFTTDSVRITLTTPYWLGRFPITNRYYQSCLDTGACTAPDTSNYDRQIGESYFTSTSRRDHPVAGITWEQARAVCRFFGAELPSFAQWLFAARGDDARSFPWGEIMACDRGFYSRIWRDQDRDAGTLTCFPSGPYPEFHQVPTAVGRFPAGAGPFGSLDLLGNVSEWLQDGVSDHIAYSRALAAMPVELIDPVVTVEPDRHERLTAGLNGADGVAQSWAALAMNAPGRIQPTVGVRCLWHTNPNVR